MALKFGSEMWNVKITIRDGYFWKGFTLKDEGWPWLLHALLFINWVTWSLIYARLADGMWQREEYIVELLDSHNDNEIVLIFK